MARSNGHTSGVTERFPRSVRGNGTARYLLHGLHCFHGTLLARFVSDKLPQFCISFCSELKVFTDVCHGGLLHLVVGCVSFGLLLPFLVLAYAAWASRLREHGHVLL